MGMLLYNYREEQRTPQKEEYKMANVEIKFMLTEAIREVQRDAYSIISSIEQATEIAEEFEDGELSDDIATLLNKLEILKETIEDMDIIEN